MHTNFVSHVAEMAMASETSLDFYQGFVETARRFVAADAGGIISVQATGAGDVASNLDDPLSFGDAVTRLVTEVTPEEVAIALSHSTMRSDVMFSGSRRDELHMFREYMRTRGLTVGVFRLWTTSNALHFYAFAPPRSTDFERFASQAVPLLDQAFPVLALAERLFEQAAIEPLTTELSAQFGLTKAEHETLALVIRGLTNPEIAQLQRISPNTVRNRLVAVYRKLGVSTRAEAVFVVSQLGKAGVSVSEDTNAAYRRITGGARTPVWRTAKP
jgi:DNA-binding CsgD family transcriptional regulator